MSGRAAIIGYRAVFALTVVVACWALFAPDPGEGGIPDWAGHFVLFFVLGLTGAAAALDRPTPQRVRFVVGFGLGFALFTELVQATLPTRTFGVMDLVSDFTGTAGAALLVGLVGRAHRPDSALRH